MPDFSVSVQPQALQVTAGGGATVTVSVAGVNGFSDPVTLSVPVPPAGVSASPGVFTLTPGSQQTVTVSAAFWAPAGNVRLTLSGTAATRTHTQTIAVQLAEQAFDRHSPGRTRYLRTDTFADSNTLTAYPQQNFAIYDSATRRFFLADPRLNVLIAFDAVRETEIARIAIPGALSMDLSPDHSILWVGTQVADLYKVDPVGLSVTERIRASEIGPNGLQAFQPRALADGRLVLLGGKRAPWVSRSQVGVWDPRTNSLQAYVSSEGAANGFAGEPICGGFQALGALHLSADRSKIYVTNGGSNATLCELDPATGSYRTITTPIGYISGILPTPDGKTLILGGLEGYEAVVYDAATLTRKSAFHPGTRHFYLLAHDGDGVYLFDEFSPEAYLYDYNTWQIKGWIPTFMVTESWQQTVSALAIDETGLVFGEVAHGVGFVDGAALQTGSTATGIGWSVAPPLGSPAGGTLTLVQASLSDDFVLGHVYFGNRPGSVLSKGEGHLNVTTPAGGSGAVDVTAISTSGAVLLDPEAFSYGPQIVQVLSTHATAEGGSLATIVGYGFGGTEPTTPSDLLVLVGGQQATITSFIPAYNAGTEGPKQQIGIALPAGSPGTTADITVSNALGSSTARGAITYLPAVRSIQHAGSSFQQGVYDGHRDVYYFSDVNAVQVFSATFGRWLAPLMTSSDPNSRLLGVSISPDGSKLAVSDFGASKIHVVDLGTNAARSFDPPVFITSPPHPAGLAITDGGMVYFADDTSGSAIIWALDTTTGTFTLPFGASGQYGATTRILVSADNSRIYVNSGYLRRFDVSSGRLSSNELIDWIGCDMAFSGDQTRMVAGTYLMDANLTLSSYLVLNERESAVTEPIYGTKLSRDGTLVFSPERHAISVFDGELGTRRARVALPVALAPVYDALVVNGRDNVLVGITGTNADTVTIFDLGALPDAPPLRWAERIK